VDLRTALSDLGVILGIVGMASFAFAYFKSDVTKKTVDQLKDLAEALELRVNNLEAEREQMLESIHKLEQENEVLRSLLDGQQHSDELADRIDINHRELLTLFEKTIEKIENLLKK
jgi:cell shape-determining protein MreC